MSPRVKLRNYRNRTAKTYSEDSLYVVRRTPRGILITRRHNAVVGESLGTSYALPLRGELFLTVSPLWNGVPQLVPSRTPVSGADLNSRIDATWLEFYRKNPDIDAAWRGEESTLG